MVNSLGEIKLHNNKKLFFVSDMHLGVPDFNSSLKREKEFVSWLLNIQNEAEAIFLLGDVFDFWFEYKNVVPKGFTRLLGTLARIVDSGIPVHFFKGNHDQWTFGYLEDELGLTVHSKPLTFTCEGKVFCIGHGDGLGPGDHGYKFIKKVFSNSFNQWVFKCLHPDLGISLAKFWSGSSRKKNQNDDEKFKGEENEWLISFCKDFLKKQEVNYFIFGHRHLFIDFQLNENSRYINLGHWFFDPRMIMFDGKNIFIDKIAI